MPHLAPPEGTHHKSSPPPRRQEESRDPRDTPPRTTGRYSPQLVPPPHDDRQEQSPRPQDRSSSLRRLHLLRSRETPTGRSSPNSGPSTVLLRYQANSPVLLSGHPTPPRKPLKIPVSPDTLTDAPYSTTTVASGATDRPLDRTGTTRSPTQTFPLCSGHGVSRRGGGRDGARLREVLRTRSTAPLQLVSPSGVSTPDRPLPHHCDHWGRRQGVRPSLPSPLRPSSSPLTPSLRVSSFGHPSRGHRRTLDSRCSVGDESSVLLDKGVRPIASGLPCPSPPRRPIVSPVVLPVHRSLPPARSPKTRLPPGDVTRPGTRSTFPGTRITSPLT